MKIFNWVQKKLHQNVIKDGVMKNVKKKESSEIERNTKAILDQVGLVDVLENWVDGVLTIGTFGFDTLKYSDEISVQDDDDEEGVLGDEDESMDLDDDVEEDKFTKNSMIVYRDEELDPLISSKEDTEVVVGSDNGVDDDLGFGFTDSESIRAVDCVDLTTDMDVDRHGKKRRTTLAELFMEDGSGDGHFKKSLMNVLDQMESSSYGKYKLNGSKLSNHSLAKKMVSRAKEQDSHPIKKLHQMMKRMLKRKIHPDVDVGKICRSDGLKSEAVESVYLLNLPDPVA